MTDHRQLQVAHRRDIVALFDEQLAARCGRGVDELRADGLCAYDFRVGEEVELVHSDGSTLLLRHAFLLVDPARRLLGIFSEHCGYYCFGTFDLRVRQLVGGECVAEQVF